MLGEHVASVRAEGDRLVHLRRAEQHGLLPLRQLGELARGVVLEQILVVRVAQEEPIRRVVDGLRTGLAGERPIRDAAVRRLGATSRRHEQREQRALGRPLQHVRRAVPLPVGAGARGGHHGRVAHPAGAAGGRVGRPHLRVVGQVREEGDARPVRRPREVGGEAPRGEVDVDEAPLVQPVQPEVVDPPGVEVPEAVRPGADLHLRESERRLRHERQRGQLVDLRNQEVVTVGARVVERRVVLVGGEDLLDRRGRQDVVGLVRVDGRGGLLGPRRGGHHEQEQQRTESADAWEIRSGGETDTPNGHGRDTVGRCDVGRHRQQPDALTCPPWLDDLH